MREENTETESTPTTPSGEQVGSTALFSRALRAICLTRDYVGEQLLPAIEGWEWYDAGVELMNAIPDDEWAEQFRLRTQPCPECQRPNPRHKDGCTTQMMREMHGESSGENALNSHTTMAKTDIENTQDTDAIGVVCSALVRPSFVFGSDDDGEPNFRSLVGPGGWECYLGEPEDALWCRDGKDAMTMLNELAARVKILSEFARTAPGRLPSNVQSALWPNA